jgi:hypothetical protein
VPDKSSRVRDFFSWKRTLTNCVILFTTHLSGCKKKPYVANTHIAFRCFILLGWDLGLRGMCVGEKRKLAIPPHLAYGERSMGASIPANSALVFEVELLKINGRGKDEL